MLPFIVISVLSSKRAPALLWLLGFPIYLRISRLNLLIDLFHFYLIIVLIILIVIRITFLLMTFFGVILRRWEIGRWPERGRQLGSRLLLLDLLLRQYLIGLVPLLLLLNRALGRWYPELNLSLPSVFNGCKFIIRLWYMMLSFLIFFDLSLRFLFFFTCSTIISMNYQLILRFLDVRQIASLMIEGLKLRLNPREKLFLLI